MFCVGNTGDIAVSEMNQLKIRISIDAEQREGEMELSKWGYREDVDYPNITNKSANSVTLGLRNAVQNAIDEVVGNAAAAKAEGDQ